MKTSANLQKLGSDVGGSPSAKKGLKVRSCCYKDGNICKKQYESVSCMYTNFSSMLVSQNNQHLVPIGESPLKSGTGGRPLVDEVNATN